MCASRAAAFLVLEVAAILVKSFWTTGTVPVQGLHEFNVSSSLFVSICFSRDRDHMDINFLSSLLDADYK
jgi:hypothetical protein